MSTEARQRLDKLLDSVGTASVQMDVAMRLLQMAREPVGVADYSRVISLDAALAARIIKAANSSYFAPVKPRTTVLEAVRMIGTTHARTLSLVFALAGLHRRNSIDPDDAKAYWHAALCKATAWASLLRSTGSNSGSPAPDTGFLYGLLQDLAVPLLAEAGGSLYRGLLIAPDAGIEAQLEAERKMFDTDHASVGRLIGERMGLPDWLLTVIELHHTFDWMQRAAPPAAAGEMAPLSRAKRSAAVAAQRGPEVVIGAAVSLMPHDIRAVSPRDAEMIEKLLATGIAGPWTGVTQLMDQVRQELTGVMGQVLGFDQKINLGALYGAALLRLAEQTEELVGQVAFLSGSHQNMNRLTAR